MKVRFDARTAQFNAYDIIVRNTDAGSALRSGALRSKLDSQMAEKLVSWIGEDEPTASTPSPALVVPARRAGVGSTRCPDTQCSPKVPPPPLLTTENDDDEIDFTADPGISVPHHLDLEDCDAAGDATWCAQVNEYALPFLLDVGDHSLNNYLVAITLRRSGRYVVAQRHFKS